MRGCSSSEEPSSLVFNSPAGDTIGRLTIDKRALNRSTRPVERCSLPREASREALAREALRYFGAFIEAFGRFSPRGLRPYYDRPPIGNVLSGFGGRAGDHV